MGEEYRSFDPLQIRIETHRRYSEHVDDPETAVIDRIALRPHEDVLDVGSGTGSFLRRLAGAGHRGRLAALDSAPAAIDALRGLPGITGCLGDATALPWPDGSFDVVTARHMLYHVDEPVAAITEARRVLRTGGRFAAVVNLAGVTPMLVNLTAAAVAAHGLDPTAFHLPVDGDNLPAMVEQVFGTVQVDRHPNAFIFDDPAPVARYAISMLAGFGVPDDHRLRPAIANEIIDRAAALFADGGVRRDPKGFVVTTAMCH